MWRIFDCSDNIIFLGILLVSIAKGRSGKISFSYAGAVSRRLCRSVQSEKFTRDFLKGQSRDHAIGGTFAKDAMDCSGQLEGLPTKLCDGRCDIYL